MRLVAANNEMTFTEIAKLVGRQWQALPTNVRESYKVRAEAGKKRYDTEVAEYVGTPEYHAYQRYVAGFQDQQAKEQVPLAVV